MDERIERALERLDESCVGELKLWNPAQAPITGFVKPLAALIHQNSDPWNCGCTLTYDLNQVIHAPDCATIALCEAVAGEA